MSRLAAAFEDLLVSARFLTALPGYLRKTLSIAEATAVIKNRFERRERNFVQIEMLETDLPARFGGGATDDQLVEQEGRNGEPEVRILVNPKLEAIDLNEVREFFHSWLGQSKDGEKLMELYWKSSGFLKAERQAPYQTKSGKIPHVYHLA